MQIFGRTEAHASPLDISVQRIETSLQPTLWPLAQDGSRARGLVLLEDGEGWIEAGDGGRERVEGATLHWRVATGGLRFRAEAGSTGYIAGVGEAFLDQASMDHADATSLASVVDRDQRLTLDPRAAEAAAAILASVREEQRAPRAGSAVVIAAQFRILLVTMLRVSGLDISLEGSGSDARFLQRFRQLVEANYRAHWPVRRYAQSIGISHDRLHSLCTRRLGRTPKALISERVAREASLRLERSTLTLEQLSHALGFRDPAHFSHFFKRVAGISPGAYRRRAAGFAPPAISAASFADWP